MSEMTDFAERLPWVTRLDEPTDCIGFKAGTPLKAIYRWGPNRQNPPIGLEAYRCKNPAYWHFEALLPKHNDEFTADTGNYCWSHLLSRGLYGTYSEFQRTEAY